MRWCRLVTRQKIVKTTSDDADTPRAVLGGETWRKVVALAGLDDAPGAEDLHGLSGPLV